MAFRLRNIPIRLTIESDDAGLPESIHVSYEGNGFKRIFRRRRQGVEVFSNELAKQCTKAVF